MKKISYVLAGVVLSFCLTGCGDTKEVQDVLDSVREQSQGSQENEDRQESQESEDRQESQESQDTQQEIEEEESFGGGYSEGRIGDTMETYFFDYTINSAYLCEEYNGYEPMEGNCLLVAEATVKNTFNESIIMYDTDFQVQWNSDGADDYDYPITGWTDLLSDDQLPEEYELGINMEKTGLLVFEVPEGRKDFSISYLELFSDNTEGDVYFVFFSAEMQ